MIAIFYCEEPLFDLPPPTLFYRGSSKGFSDLATAVDNMLHCQQELCVNHIPGVTISGTKKHILFRPFDNQAVSLMTDDNIVTDMSEADWQEVSRQLRNMAEAASSQTYFLELTDYIDQVNVVFES